MTRNELNDAPVLDQVREHYQKLLALTLWKLSRSKPVLITVEDIEAFNTEGPVLLTHGKRAGFELSLISAEAAERLAAFKQPQGNA